METVEYKDISFTVWDVGGQDKVCTFSFAQNFPVTYTGIFQSGTLVYIHF